MVVKKRKCPRCGKETLERIWYGTKPQTCPNCGYTPKEAKVEY